MVKKNSKCDKTQNVTKIKNSTFFDSKTKKCDKNRNSKWDKKKKK